MYDTDGSDPPEREEAAAETVEDKKVEDGIEEAPRPLEPWHVEDFEVGACIPDHGFIKEYMDYVPTTCDGPLWFQLGGVLTILSVLGAKSDVYVEAENGRYEVDGLHLWSANVGYTGSRKSRCVKPAINILRSVSGKAILATDASIEALHDVLADREGVGLLHRDEMSTLFVQARRSYSTGFTGWLLEAYNGGPTERLTKAGGSVQIPRVRLSIMGNIPPSTLQVNTSREDWRAGFLPRFCFWGARRTRYMPISPGDPQREDYFAEYVKKYIFNRQVKLIVPHEMGRILTDWHRKEVDAKGRDMPDELYSALLRLRSKSFQFAALYALARLNYIPKDGAGIVVDQKDVEYALEIVKLLRRSTSSLFSYVGGTEEATQEKMAITHIALVHRATPSTLSSALGISAKAATAILQSLVSASIIEKITEKTGGRGRPKIFYVLPNKYPST